MIKKQFYILVAILFIVLLCTTGYTQSPNQKAKAILEKFFTKYEMLFSDTAKSTNTAVCKMSIKGVGRLDTSKSSTNAPLLIDTKAELYVANPSKMCINLKGNMGNVSIVVPDKKPMAAVALFPDSKQYATISVPQRMFGGVNPSSREKFWQESTLNYMGLQDTKQGKAHKIIIKSTRPTQKEATTIFILDKKWDPIRIELSDPKSGSTVVDFDQILLNSIIPPEKFVPNTKGYTQVSKEQLTGILMMNIMASTMVKKPIK
jgi:outer membrane lipoprotein-sorting protein